MRGKHSAGYRIGWNAWRRLLCVLAVMLLAGGTALAVAEEPALRGYDMESKTYVYVLFGRYPQTIDGGIPDDGNQTWLWRAQYQSGEIPTADQIKTEPILWRVLTADEEQVFLCSEFVLFASPINTDYQAYVKNGGRFETTELYAKLNGPFLEEAFTAEEQSTLIRDEAGGAVTLLTAANLNDKSLGFGTNKTRKAWGTEYAIRVTGSFVYRIQMGNHSPYWVQDQSSNDPRHARCTKQEGTIGRINVITENESARPVIHLRQGAYRIVSGEGTREQPYVLAPEQDS